MPQRRSAMLFAKVVVGLAVSGPFDYIVPGELKDRISPGSRVWVQFGPRKTLGYVVGLSAKSKISKLKEISELIDESPVLDEKMLSLTNRLAEYYCCSWGEAIETALPEALRRGKNTDHPGPPARSAKWVIPDDKNRSLLIHDLDGHKRWEVYLEEIKVSLSQKKSAIIILPDIDSIPLVQDKLKAINGISVSVLYRKASGELKEWERVRSGSVNVVIGTRSAVFAPLNNLGLIIIDEEENSVYKQDQVPHYHAREIALMRAGLVGARVILGSKSPSLESFVLAKKGKLEYRSLKRETDQPEIRVIDMKSERSFSKGKKEKVVFSKYLMDSIFSEISAKEKTLLFLNRKGFATFAHCQNCGKVLKCPRCNVHLVYHFKAGQLSCHYCAFKMKLPEICPDCNAGYIKFSGTGTEKIESELSRLFPQAKIKDISSEGRVDITEADIFVDTSAVFKQEELRFDLAAVLSIDNSLNRVDFRSTEKVFMILSGLLCLINKKLIIQTYSPAYSCFQALQKNDALSFYEEELKQRKQLKFPPFKHFILVKARSRSEEKARDCANAIFEKLQKASKGKALKVVSVSPGPHVKLRGNYYWQVLLSCDDPVKANKFLKLNLKDIRHSGIIVTVDVDPV
jgi:primosomal protein N' (replication factor Y)